MKRIEKAMKLVEENDVAALIIDHPIDLFYLLGIELSLGRLVISKESAILFVDGRYYESCCNSCPIQVKLTSSYSKESAFGKWWEYSGQKVGFDAEVTPYADYETLLELNSELVPLKGPLKKIREIKEPSEALALKKAAELGSRGYDFICTQLKEGVTEKEIARALEIFWLKEGGEKMAFAPHIAFGKESSKPHYQVSGQKLKKNHLVLMDIGVVLDHYHSDMTRVLAFGRPKPELENVYKIVYEAYSKALELCRAGVRISEIDRAARGWIDKKGYKECFPHGLGHGIGLQIHESPRIRGLGSDADRCLQEGMVITIEPGIYLPEIGGVRLEDTILITKDGFENLTNRPISPQLPILDP